MIIYQNDKNLFIKNDYYLSTMITVFKMIKNDNCFSK